MNKAISILFLLFSSTYIYSQHNNLELPTSMNQFGTAPNASAILDVQASDKGVLIPRMTEASRNQIVAPAVGLLIYQVDNSAGFYYFGGASWLSLGGISGGTLDQAYDAAGLGTGRFINADAGAVEIIANTNTGVALIANSNTIANTFSTIQSTTTSNSNTSAAILGNSEGAAWGVSGQVSATASGLAAVYGSNLRTTGGHGILGHGFNGVVGETDYSVGISIWGENYNTIDPIAGNGAAVAGIGRFGVIGQDRYNGSQSGAYGVFSSGDFGSSGTKAFVIDHPTDPENKILRHFSTESNEVLNLYRGNAIFDENGEAVVVLADYFEDINRNPSYQLTPIGDFANLYIKQEIRNNTFIIAGGRAGMKVSWTVYAERNDAYLQKYPEKRATVLEKSASQKGDFLMPNLYDSEKAFFLKSRGGKTEQKEMEVKE